MASGLIPQWPSIERYGPFDGENGRSALQVSSWELVVGFELRSGWYWNPVLFSLYSGAGALTCPVTEARVSVGETSLGK